MMAVLVGLCARLFYLQIVQHDYYMNLAVDQIIYKTEVNPSRGEILDRNGKILATNVSVYRIILSPDDIRERMKQDNGATYTYTYVNPDGVEMTNVVTLDKFIALYLSHTFSVDYDEILAREAKENRQYEAVGEKISEEEADVFRAFVKEYDLKRCIYLEESAARYYPYETVASHVIGFLNSEGVGIYGLESYYNNLLEGTSGRYVSARNPYRQDIPFDYESFIDPKNGYSIVTTIDLKLQTALEAQLKQVYEDSKAGQRVAGIVLDVNTGGVLAMATYPPFDCNNPYQLDEDSMKVLEAYPADSEEYQAKRLELLYSMWKNKAVTDTYIPGSTFKIITAAMALEENVVTTSSMFKCKGSKVIVDGTQPVHCFRTSGHGSISFAVGLQQSCNVVFMDVAEKLGPEKMYSYIQSFGYLNKTGIDLPAESSTIILGKNSFMVDPMSQQIYSFGQNFNTTIIQQISAIAAVANGGQLLTPHLISAIVDSEGNVVTSYEPNVVRQVVSQETCDTVAEMLMEGVSGNGGAKNAYVEGYNIAAKTGTSEKKDTKEDLRVGSCVAYAPAEAPTVAAMIVVDEPNAESVYGSVVAAPYVANFLSEALPYLGVEAKENGRSTLISNYVGLKKTAALNALSYEGIKYEIVGDGEMITAQVPANGSKIDKDNGILVLYTEGQSPLLTIKMPYVVDMSYEKAISKLRGLGLNVIVSGSTDGDPTVISQSIESGVYLSRGAIVTIEVRHMNLLDD